MNTDNPLEVVLNRLGWRDPAKAVCFHWDEVRHWQEGALDALLASGIVKPAEPLTTVSCNSCDEDCHAVEVQTFPAQNGQPARPVIRCAMGIVKVDIRRLAQWKAMSAWLADGLVKLLGLRQSGINPIDARQWELGIFKGKKERCTITMRVEKGVALLIAANTVPLLDVLTLTENVLVLDKEALAYWVDKSNAESNAEHPEVRRARLKARIAEEKAKGTKAFNQVVADKEGISISRLKQITEKKPSPTAPLEWGGLSSQRATPSQKKTKSKY